MSLSKSVIILISVYVWLYHMVIYLKNSLFSIHLILNVTFSENEMLIYWIVLTYYGLKVKYEEIFFYPYHLFRTKRRHKSDTSIYIFKSFILLQNIGKNMYEEICYHQVILLGNLMEVSMHEFQCIFIPLLLCKIS